MRFLLTVLSVVIAFMMANVDAAERHPHAAQGVTSLTNKSVKYEVAKKHFVVLKRGDVTAVIVDNGAVDNKTLPGHRAGYNGVASLTHAKQKKNLFVPPYAGLNFEHIHDGTLAVAKEKFEPRRAKMELRVIDEQTVELYQPPTPNWKLESCGRYRLLKDGVIEYTFECIPRAKTFRQRYIGLFWASYIDRPKDKAIHFRGFTKPGQAGAKWIRAVTPRHGVDSTHPPAGKIFRPKVDAKFPLTLVNHPSKYSYADSWYYGASGKMAFALMFRKRDRIWFAQSPTGGGRDNPAWDFQWFVPDYKVGEAYGFVMRAAYVPFQNRGQLERATKAHRAALNE